MRTRRTLLNALVVAIMTMISGCSEIINLVTGPPPVEALETEVVDVRTPDAGITSATIPIILEVENTHSKAEIPSATLDYRVFVNDIEVATAREEIASLGPGDTSKEELEVTIQYANLGSSTANAIKEGSFTVKIEGVIESGGAETEFTSVYDL